jgi:hypothetical protein
MGGGQLPGLSPTESELFLEKGYVVLRGCFSEETARQWVEKAYVRLGCDPREPSTWKAAQRQLGGETGVKVADFAPRAWAAIEALCGGADRIKDAEKHSWSDCFEVHFPAGEDSPRAWHLAGDAAPRTPASPAPGLVTYVFWNEAGPRGGGLSLACDSIAHVARHLSRHAAGSSKDDIPADRIIAECRDFVELTGKAGDVVLLHPLLLHAPSPNRSGLPSFWTSRNVELARPLSLERSNAEDLSLLERAVLRARRSEAGKTAPVLASPSRRRFHAYGVGLSRTGTGSLAAIFGRYRSAHQFLRDEHEQAVQDLDAGKLSRAQMRDFLLRRHREKVLEMDSAANNGRCVDILAEEFPSAKFILLIRDFYSWLNSEQNKLLIRARTPEAWPKPPGSTPSPRESVAAGLAFYQSDEAFVRRFEALLEVHVKEWTEVNQFILDRVPASRLLIVRTCDLSRSREKLARFVGVPPETLVENAHMDKAPHDLRILSKVDPEMLERRVRERCGPLMDRFFPGYGLKEYLKGMPAPGG